MSNFQLFRNSVRATPSSSGGTQSDELQAKIKSVTSSTTIGACFIYDTRSDSDSGAWRKKTQGLSWYDEDLNTTTRGGRREFPSVALLVLDEESAEETLTIYDLDDPSMPMWMQFLDAGALKWSTTSPRSFNAVTALNGRIYVGFQDGLVEFDFANDHTKIGFSGPRYLTSGTAIADRNVTATFATGGDGYTIANIVVNDVAATVLEGAEIGALGLPIPTIGVATDGGVSVIHPNGSVVNSSSTGAKGKVAFNENGDLAVSASGDDIVDVTRNAALYSASWTDNYRIHDAGSHARDEILITDGYSTGQNKNIAATNYGWALGKGGLTLIKLDDGNPNNSAVAVVQSTYNTGYMLGDIRLATLANSTVDGSTGATMHDRSVKGNNLTEQGNVNQAAVATDAELQYYTNFGSDNYLNRAYSADFNFTNTMSVMFWVKDYTTKDIYGIGTRNSTLSQSIYIDGGYDIRFSLTSDGSTEQQFEIPESGVLDQWTFICFSVNAGAVRGYKNGQNIAASNGTFTGNIFSQATDQEGLEIGKGAIVSEGSSTGKLALFRISATAPTPQQVKEIYEAEKPLFRAGAKCLLQASSDSVLDLSYDKTTDLLSVGHYGTTAGRTDFKNLEAVNTFDGSAHGWSVRTTNLLASNGGVIAQAKTAGTGGVIVDIPPVDVRGDLNTADSKLPDDGKFHFSGVTTNATPTVIGNIPVAENEAVNVIVRIEGARYDLRSSSWNFFGEIKQQFYRNLGGDVAARDEASKLINEGTASTDFDLDISTSAQTVQVKVTGSSSLRIQWNATVEVQRISEKTYER